MSNAVVLGFSGGVDSACAAEMLRRRGHEVRCLYLETGSGEAEAARAPAIAKAMGLPLEVIDARAELEKYVCRPFAEAYKRGDAQPMRPVQPEVKLRMLCEYADSLGVEHIATGHYARAEGGRSSWAEPENDQSYMLCRILPEQLRRRAAAGRHDKGGDARSGGKMGPARGQPDSMELCFVPDRDYAAWLERRGDAPGRASSSSRAGPWRGTAASTASPSASAGAWATPRGGGSMSPRYGRRRGRSSSQRGGPLRERVHGGGYALAGPRAGGALRLRRPHPPLTRARARSRPCPCRAAGFASPRPRPPRAPTPTRPPRSMSAPRSWEAVSCCMIQRIQIRYIFC